MPNKLRISMLHNYYQIPGGEDVSTRAEIDVLRKHGHDVELLVWDNKAIQDMKIARKIHLFWQTTWNSFSEKEVFERLKRFDSDIFHVQNFFPLASPSVYTAARRLNIPTIQHLRNFRLGCLNSYFFRENIICEACLGHNPWRGVVHRCYRDSLVSSLSLWQMITVHRFRKTWHKDIDAFITPSKFAATKLSELGIPSENLYVKPNFIKDPLPNNVVPPMPEKPTFLYVGRLSPEKGVLSLLSAWKKVNEPDWNLKIIGSGPEFNKLKQFCSENQLNNIYFLGQINTSTVLLNMKECSALIVPSRWYETFGRVIIEAFACGRPAIVSQLGALSELIKEGVNGFTVSYTNESEWIERIKWCGNNPLALAEMGINARNSYQMNYTEQQNYELMLSIYTDILR